MARMELTDQKHSSDNALSEQEVIRRTEKTARLFGLDTSRNKKNRQSKKSANYRHSFGRH